MIVIASIQEPSTNTLLLFDNILLLSQGQTVYYGPPGSSVGYFRSLGHPLPPMASPSEFMLDLTNAEFELRYSQITASFRIESLIHGWEASVDRKLLEDQIVVRESKEFSLAPSTSTPQFEGSRSVAMQSFILFYRMALVLDF
jgi:hypothetical protein